MRSAALIVAAGSGVRFRTTKQTGVAKQYQPLGGRAMLAHSLQTCLSHPNITHVQVVIAQGDESAYLAVLDSLALDSHQKQKLCPHVHGGTSRQQSVWHGLQALQNTTPPPAPASIRPYS